MTKHHKKRLLGYALWALGLIVFMPPALLEGVGLVGIHQFILFNCLVVCLFGGFLLVDSANTALDRIAHSEQVEEAAFLGTVETRRHADKHFHPPAPVTDALEDHQPDDMPAARMLVIMIVALLAVFVVIAVVLRGSPSNEPSPNASKEQPAQLPG